MQQGKEEVIKRSSKEHEHAKREDFKQSERQARTKKSHNRCGVPQSAVNARVIRKYVERKKRHTRETKATKRLEKNSNKACPNKMETDEAQASNSKCNR